MNPALISAVAQLTSIVLPLGLKVFTSFKTNADGTTDVLLTLKSADDKFNEAIDLAAKWHAAHPGV